MRAVDMGSGSDSRPAALAFAGWWAVLFGLWLALANRATASEVVAGLVAAAIGAGAAVRVRRQRPVVARAGAAQLLRIAGPLAGVPRDLWRLGRALAQGLRGRPPAGRLQEVPFAAGGDDPRAAAHRVLAVAAGSLAPNTIVVDVDAERGRLVVHRLLTERDDDPSEPA
jgi:multisubunit Na+/H+ antiporter MnhE subunit